MWHRFKYHSCLPCALFLLTPFDSLVHVNLPPLFSTFSPYLATGRSMGSWFWFQISCSMLLQIWFQPASVLMTIQQCIHQGKSALWLILFVLVCGGYFTLTVDVTLIFVGLFYVLSYALAWLNFVYVFIHSKNIFVVHTWLSTSFICATFVSGDCLLMLVVFTNDTVVWAFVMYLCPWYTSTLHWPAVRWVNYLLM
jgi:hypothetical protein